MLVSLHEIIHKVPNSLTWSLKQYDMAVPSFLIQDSYRILRNEVSRIGFSELWKISYAIHRMIWLMEVSVE